MQPGSSETFETTIDSVAFGGAGVGRHEGVVCFVPGTIPGERVRVAVAEKRKSFLKCWPVEVLSASPDRVSPDCPLAEHRSGHGSLCPGCVYQHLTLNAELHIKQSQFAEMLRHQAEVEPDSVLRPPIDSPELLGYRNKIVLHVQMDGAQTALGYFMHDNVTVLDVPECPLAHCAINQKLCELRHDPGFFHTLRDGMQVTFRHTEQNGVVFWRNRPSGKESWLREATPFGSVSVPYGGFFQVNPACGGRLMAQVADILQRGQPERFVDGYCGAGYFSMVAASVGVPNIIGWDSDSATIQSAEYNLRSHPLSQFIVGNSSKLIREVLSHKALDRTTMLVDPPRRGLDRRVTQLLTNSGLHHLIYVSCGPDTLCRDLRQLLKGGFQIKHTQLLNMFPRTAHFETITELERQRNP